MPIASEMPASLLLPVKKERRPMFLFLFLERTHMISFNALERPPSRRMVLEAVAYGTFLRDVEQAVDQEYGVLTYMQGGNMLPPSGPQ